MYHNEEEHAKMGGEDCPYCGADEVEGGNVDTGGGQATQTMFCLACGRDWLDHYVLTGYILTEEG